MRSHRNRQDPPFIGGFPSSHSLNDTPEFAYGVTDCWEVGSLAHLSARSTPC
jgi:hypothetical protein